MMWRSLLFVPVLEERLLTRAADRGADALVLDLEASIPKQRKLEARQMLRPVVEQLAAKIDITVRINPTWLEAVRDLEASIMSGVKAIHLARCESDTEIIAVDRLIGELEIERGLNAGSVRLVAMLESPEAVIRAAEIARSSRRLSALTLGVEDYATAMGVAATPELLRPAGRQVIQAARAAGLDPLVVPASMSEFRDIEQLESAASYARTQGSTGGYAIHPLQVPVLNRVFSPTAGEQQWATRVVQAVEHCEPGHSGVWVIDGDMIDLPLIKRAYRILQRPVPTAFTDI